MSNAFLGGTANTSVTDLLVPAYASGTSATPAQMANTTNLLYPGAGVQPSDYSDDDYGSSGAPSSMETPLIIGGAVLVAGIAAYFLFLKKRR